MKLTKPLVEMSYFELVRFLNRKYGVAKYSQKEFIQWEAAQGKVRIKK